MRQASRCNSTQLHVHTQRQRALGEKMPADHDRPRWPEIVVVLAVVVAAATCIIPTL